MPTELEPTYRNDGLLQRAVTIHVNERPVRLPQDRVTGLAIKESAVAQGVPIQLDFILVEELGGGRTKVIGDADHVEVNAESRFLANDGDDNS
jgi:hypothetical protein